MSEHRDDRPDIVRKLEEFDIDIKEHPGTIKRISARADSINWDTIRRTFVLGRRIQLEDGSYASEDITLKDLASMFGVKYNYMRHKASQDNWTALRKAYLARVNQLNIGMELGLYTQENYQSEISALNACNKLGKVLDKYIEFKFGEILDSSADVNDDGHLSEEVTDAMKAVNRNTGTPVFITEVKEAIKVANDIYKLSRQIYDNAPKTELEVIEKLTNKPKFRNEKERLAKIKQLEAKLGKRLGGGDELQETLG